MQMRSEWIQVQHHTNKITAMTWSDIVYRRKYTIKSLFDDARTRQHDQAVRKTSALLNKPSI